MKKAWTTLLSLATKAAGKDSSGKTNYWRADKIYTHWFLKHHQNADSITFDREGRPLNAVYKCGDMRDGQLKKEREFSEAE